MAAYIREIDGQREVMVGYKKHMFINAKSAVDLHLQIAGKVYKSLEELIAKAKIAMGE